ncbi:hypothetical protein CBR_g23030 [Chara braunii]|uniref:Myb-like domain-containing protein n=1 Tax=Chara braunii TaxID=69332 RepID=A0A388L3C9_CHABU|nr:hypothetical protein CBR_g23030 [Chara braunii]|eukprot:GBG76815.1 hypothetical protein CBR_g23030 [Chara braunii]
MVVRRMAPGERSPRWPPLFPLDMPLRLRERGKSQCWNPVHAGHGRSDLLVLSQVEGGQGGTTYFSSRASAVPGSTGWGIPQDGQNCVGFSGPNVGVGGQRQQPRLDGVVGSKGTLSMDVESEPSLAQGSLTVDCELGPYSTMLQCSDGGSDMQPASRFPSSRSLGGKGMGSPSHGGPEGVHGNADFTAGDAWMGGVADIAGTQYGGCSSGGSDGEFSAHGRSDVSSIDGSVRRARAVGGGGDGEPAAKAKGRAAAGGGGGEGEPAATSRNRAPPGGDGLGGEPAAKGKPRSPDWSTDESVGLLTYLFEEDALQEKRKGRQKMRTRRERYEWIITKLVEKGFEARNVEECERKFYNLLDCGKRIRDFHNRSGEQIYWNMDRVSRKKEGFPVSFDKQLFDALRWKLQKAEGSCEGLMNSVQYNEGWSSAVTDDDDTGGRNGSPVPRRRDGNDGGEGSKSARTEGGGGSARWSRSQSSAEVNRGGGFADVAHALVESNDRQAEKLAGTFANAMDGINNILAQGNATLLQCFTMLSGALSGRPADNGPPITKEQSRAGNVKAVHASPRPHHVLDALTRSQRRCGHGSATSDSATSDTVPRQQCHVSSATSAVPRQTQCHVSSATSDTVPRQQCHVSSATSDIVPRQQCPATMTGAALGMPDQLANESIADYKKRFQAQLAAIEAEEQRRLAPKAAQLHAEAAATAEKLRLEAEADAGAQAHRKEAQDLLQRHEAASIESSGSGISNHQDQPGCCTREDSMAASPCGEGKFGPRPQHVAAVQTDTIVEDPAAAQASREGDQVAAVQPRSNNNS